MDKTELKKIRLELGLSQYALAKYLKTPRTTYFNWEKGERRIPGILEVALETVKRRVKTESKVK
ncbi:MAG: XRE family transcriptional regulator [Candidatus Electrothrix sp. AR3]|nr:XRE family transcriptional regulator [Candidatus Electrothrix sp. AR3]